MPELHQTYVTQIQNNLSLAEQKAVALFDAFSPISAEASKMAVIGTQAKLNKAQLNTQLQQAFNINKRHAGGVIAFAEGEVGSAAACHLRHIETLEAKIKGCKETIKKIDKRLKAHRKYVVAVGAYNKAFNIAETQNRQSSDKKEIKQKKFTKLPEFDVACPINGKPHGKTYLQLAKQGLHQKKRQQKMWEDRLAAIRNRGVIVNQGKLGQVSFVGSSGETGGNQICQFQPGIMPILQIRVPYFLEPNFGKFVDLPLHKFNKKGQAEILQAWAMNKAITYVFSKNKHGKWVVAITVKAYFKITSENRSKGVFGLDINPGSIGWCSTNEHGNPIAWGNIKTDLHSCSTDQTIARLAESVTEITTRALAMNKPITIEKLDFSNKKQNMKPGRKYRRMLSGFAYAKFTELLKSRCLKLGIRVIEVSPKYSSQIGVSKYMKRYGMGSDSAAGLVIARRGMGIYFESLPARYAFQKDGTVMLPSPRKHVFAHWQSFSGRYKVVKSRNDWFSLPILTGLLGKSSEDTGSAELSSVKNEPKARQRKGEKPCQVSWV
jgi:IS605 OrfB family transposase